MNSNFHQNNEEKCHRLSDARPRTRLREETRVYVNEIHVDEAYRGKGIGRELMRAVENMAKESGYRAMYIHAEGDNERAIRLYQHEGYTIERVQLRKAL